VEFFFPRNGLQQQTTLETSLQQMLREMEALFRKKNVEPYCSWS